MEIPRSGGYRRVGGIYLVSRKCIPLTNPIPLHKCPTCGEETKMSRNIVKVNPLMYANIDYLMMVSKHLYPTIKDFIDEADELGVSKRVPFVAKGITFNNTIIGLVHESVGVFAYFIPERADVLIWEKDASVEEFVRLKKLHLWPIIIPDGNMNHAPYTARRLKFISETRNIMDI